VDHLAIDVGGRESQLCLRGSDGAIKEEKRIRTQDLPMYVAGLPAGRVIIEACAESFWLADAAIAVGHEVRVIPSTLVRALGVGSRSTKNDRKDARVTSEASCRIDLPSVHISSPESRERKTLLSLRECTVASRTMMINAVRGWMRGNAIRLRRSGDVVSFPERVRDVAPNAPRHVTRTLELITTLTEQIVETDRELRRMANKDSLCTTLMTVPGVGPTTAIAFKATIDVAGRFENAHHVGSYIGLTPGEYASSDKMHRTGITKAGSPRLRWLLVQAAWAARRSAPKDPMVVWSNRIEQRRGKKIAVIALARKLAGILFALWRDGTTYNPKIASGPADASTEAAA
jgi:transposase